MNLTPFEWLLILGVAGILVSALSYLIATVIKLFWKNMERETAERKEGDSTLAATLSKITERLEKNDQQHPLFADRDHVSKTSSQLYEIINSLKQEFASFAEKQNQQSQAMTDFKGVLSNVVTKSECNARCNQA